MPTSRRQQIDAAFLDAADLPPEAQAAGLDQAGLDPEARAEVEAMLAADRAADAYFEGVADRLSASADEMAARPPERAGPWRPVRLLGRGGMGEVFLAERIGAEGPEGFAQRAALKLVQPGLAPGLVARFRTERRILAGLEHPGIARLLDGGTASDGRPYLAMELVEGTPITTYCDRRRLGIDERLALFERVCEAVAFAHRRLVVHRDLKPSNVLVTDDGAVKLLDFGLARLLDTDAVATRTDLAALTPEYAAPEQLRGDLPTTAMDVYALGVLLYELLAGQRPFDLPRRLLAEAARIVASETPTDPSAAVRQPTGPATTAQTVAAARATRPDRLVRRLRGDLDRIVQVALRKEPDRRYGSAADLGRDVRRHLDGDPVTARRPTLAYRAGRFVLRHRWGVAVAAAALAVGIGVAATVVSHRAEIAAEQRRTERALVLMEGLFEDADPFRDEAGRDAAVSADTPLGDALYRAALRVAADADAEARHRLLGTLASALGSLGADSLALDLHRRRAAAAAADFGPEDGRTAEAVGGWGRRLSEAASSPDEVLFADSLLSQALDLTEVAYGPDARETGRAVVSLATHRKDHGAESEAETLARRGVAIARRQGAEALTDLETALTIWGLALTATGDPDGAHRAASEAVEVARRVRGRESVNLAPVLANAAFAAEAVDSLGLAIGYEEEAAALAAQALGAAHPTTLTVRANLAGSYQSAGRIEEAERVHRAVLGRRLAALGPRHRDVGVSCQQLASVLWERGALAEAAEQYRCAAAAFDASLPATTPTRAFPYLSLARLEADRGRFGAATESAREALRLAAASVGTEHPMHGDAEARLGRALVGIGREVEGRRHLDAALPVLRSAFGASGARVREAMQWRTNPAWQASD